MGLLFSRLFKRKTECQVLVIGLDAAGKTTIIQRLRQQKFVPTVPTVGFGIERLEMGTLTLQVWDVGGQDSIRPLWRHYYHNMQALVFVVDSADTDRMNEAAIELHAILEDPEMSGVPLLLYANKMDLPAAVDPATVTSLLRLGELKDRQFHIQAACALDGDGIVDGMKWLASVLE
jgi:small GTP-binding protein|eukprot:gnl/Ergobibamus_cyprinoides/1156.p1 GENE.gnl/Ergobibamus_cyprinoides/1156~~gnl/Ergobibamus_cyprinoides/1156.p1  ORF type:complete len:200 (+),score=39.35 gnl/Ergobibamus_cyprinoides/1156:73-600(+)